MKTISKLAQKILKKYGGEDSLEEEFEDDLSSENIYWAKEVLNLKSIDDPSHEIIKKSYNRIESDLKRKEMHLKSELRTVEQQQRDIKDALNILIKSE